MVISIHSSTLRFERPGFVMDDLTIWLVFESLRVRCCCPLLDFLFLLLISVFSLSLLIWTPSLRRRQHRNSPRCLSHFRFANSFFVCVSDFIAWLSSMLFLHVLFIFSSVVPRYRLSCSGTYGSSHLCLILFDFVFAFSFLYFCTPVCV